jgi:hypothetical protein
VSRALHLAQKDVGAQSDRGADPIDAKDCHAAATTLAARRKREEALDSAWPTTARIRVRTPIGT